MSQHLYLIKDDKGNSITFGAESENKARRMYQSVFRQANSKIVEVKDQGEVPRHTMVKVNGPDFHPVLPVEAKARPGANDPCPCGSGKKWKRCCMRKRA